MNTYQISENLVDSKIKVRDRENTMEIGWIMFGFFAFITLVFIVIAIFLPEWVGITGKKAQEYISEHRDTTNGVPPDSLSSDDGSKKL